jgi:ABC-type multidrug transport system ATPase subunit
MTKILVENLRKSYDGNILAVDGISFEVSAGSLFALLGKNGAGKSTTINILCTILKKDAGRVLLDGIDLDRDPESIKKKIGIVFQGSVLDARLSVLDNLRSRAALYGLTRAQMKERIAAVSRELALEELLPRAYGKLSGGQRRRVDIARALLNRPAVLFLDEPTTGLDPATRAMVWSKITALKRDGTTVFLTTHYMEEVSASDAVVIINNGRIAADGTPDKLKSKYTADCIRIIGAPSEHTEKILTAAGLKFRYQNGYCAEVADSRAALAFLYAHREAFSDFEILKGDMDTVFLAVTGEALTQ